jgi:hypothetical protein
LIESLESFLLRFLYYRQNHKALPFNLFCWALIFLLTTYVLKLIIPNFSYLLNLKFIET